jgi:4-hydroxythreonine-4-phosphate dehydrogenase
MGNEQQKPLIGFTCGDLNGIGIELIIKALSDNRIFEQCTPVVFASNKSINFYRKSLPEINFTYQAVRDFSRISHKQVNIFNCWDEEVPINPGQLNETGGKYAKISLQQAAKALKEIKSMDWLLRPIHKKNIQSADFAYPGHTPFLKSCLH